MLYSQFTFFVIYFLSANKSCYQADFIIESNGFLINILMEILVIVNL